MHKAFACFYFCVLALFWVLTLPFLFLFSFKQKYKISIPRRFFLYKNPPFSHENVWFHGCSLGEIKSFELFFKRLDFDINLSSITQTGFNEAKKLSQNARFLPFEIFLPFWIKRPKILVVSEAEFWYMLFFIAKLKGSYNILINARISDKSYKNYKKFAFFYKMIFACVDEVFAQSQKDADRLKELGAKNITINGNIKSSAVPSVSKSYTKPNRRVITIASSHEKEEEAILNAITLQENDQLIVVPRHPERFNKVKNLLNDYASFHDKTLRFFSKHGFCECDILLCDTLGELINIYAVTDIVVLCGSFFDKIGGHNPLECAYFNTKIISGKYFHNQHTLYDLVENINICDLNEINTLLSHNLKPSSIKNTDAIEPIIKKLKDLYETRKSL